jgi:hypothetical protein
MKNETLKKANKLVATMAKYQQEMDTLRGMKQILSSAPDAPFYIMYEPTQKKILIPRTRSLALINDALDEYVALLTAVQTDLAAL